MPQTKPINWIIMFFISMLMVKQMNLMFNIMKSSQSYNKKSFNQKIPQIEWIW